MLKRFLLLLAAAVSIQAAAVTAAYAAEEKRPEVGRYVKAYSGSENIKVWTTRVGPESNHEVLLQIGGVDHAWDMKIMKVKVESTNMNDKYVTQVDGKPFVVFVLTEGSGEIYLPKVNKPYRVGYDKNLSEQGNSEHFLTDYLQQGKK